jgi:hypothetical protein
MAKVHLTKVGKCCLQEFERLVVPRLESMPIEMLDERIILMTESIPLPCVLERVWPK